MIPKFKIALAGNPNSGKTTIFNRITGAHQHVGNYPGVTVEVREGTAQVDGTPLLIADLPGTYSLNGLSEEEIAARNYLFNINPDAVIDIVDASTLERQLYLAIQLLELGIPLVLAFNMTDVAERAGYEFNLDLLSELLGVPIVMTTGISGGGINELLTTAIKVAGGKIVSTPRPFSYGRVLDREIESLVTELEKSDSHALSDVPVKWIAIKLLEGDEAVLKRFKDVGGLPENVASALDASSLRLSRLYTDPADILIAEARYGIISGAVSEAVTHTVERRHDYSDELDKVLINPVAGIPIFLALMYLVFMLTFAVGSPFMVWLEMFFNWLGSAVSGLFSDGSDNPLRSLLVDGIIGGVGGVITFLPNIFLLFVAIAFLEDSGYMARAAFLMDRLMHRIGLHGKSFIPMLIGFGCSVPAILGTRILENKRDRLVTILVIPLMSCGARFPIYALIIPAFFPRNLQGPMLWLIYLIGILLAILITRILRSTVFKGESTPFVMELPPYRVPTLQALGIHSWERGAMYLRKAGTVILAISIILWAASSYPRITHFSVDYDSMLDNARTAYEARVMDLNAGLELPHDYTGILTSLDSWLKNGESGMLKPDDPRAREFVEAVLITNIPADYSASLETVVELDPRLFSSAVNFTNNVLDPWRTESGQLIASRTEEKVRYTIMGRIGHVLEPVFATMGYDWRLVTASIGALAAKEVFVAQLGIVFSIGEEDEQSTSLRQKLHEAYNPLIGFCILLFSLIATPCIATLAATRAETGTWKWPLVQFFGLTFIAWLLATIVYQAGNLLGWGV